MARTATGDREPPIADYGLIGDRCSTALVSRRGSVDWCCMPRFDSGALFCRLLGWDSGGHCAVAAVEGEAVERTYLEGTLVLETRWRSECGEARVLDYFEGPPEEGEPAIVRLIEGIEGQVEFEVELVPRFDYGQVRPWVRRGDGLWTAIGGDDGLLVRGDVELEAEGRHSLAGRCQVSPGERRRLSLAYRRPVELDEMESLEPLPAEEIDAGLERTVEWWREWSAAAEPTKKGLDEAVERSALVLKALSYEPTGAIVAAATTSLPEARDLDGSRNWDYRFAWIRDSVLAVRSLAELGWEQDADRFRRFIERSAAGHAGDLQVVFGVGGERRLVEHEAEGLRGYGDSTPVRIGNDASRQFQLDAFGQLVDQSWRWHLHGNAPDDEYWRFVADLVDVAVERWREPDCGIWEWREEPRHFVHSKALAWAAVDRGIRLAEDTGRPVPGPWRVACREIREAVEREGYDEERGAFVQAFGREELDAAVLRLPSVDFIAWDDERMVSTATAIREELDLGGLIRRYGADDGMPEEGAFLACSFWLAKCLAHQGRGEEAREVFDAAAATANDLGLFSEEYDPEAGRMLGNVPQALTHLSHIEAALALRECQGAASGS